MSLVYDGGPGKTITQEKTFCKENIRLLDDIT